MESGGSRADDAPGEGDATSGYGSLVDYVYGTTARIWEGRGVDLIDRWYGARAIVRTPLGVTVGAAPVIAGTLATLHEFPDRRLLGEDVIWCAHGEEGPAWREGRPHYSSHRIVSPATHGGGGLFGEPTGRRVRGRTFADCVVEHGRYVEEWLVRDHGGIAAQLGGDVRELARRQVEALVEAGKPVAFAPEHDVEGSYRAPPCADERALAVADMLREVWHGGLSALARGYDEAVALELFGDRSRSGIDEATRHWLSLASAMPDATFTVDHLIGRADRGRPHRVAVRWTASGAHAGPGAFGAASAAPLHVMGISQFELARGRVHREWTLIDELAIHRQIAAHTG